jgi:hypothetical protein
MSVLSGSFDVAVSIGNASAVTRISTMTSVTMDVCLAKQRFPFRDKDLIALTSHLGGGEAILRIGGSDQNSFYYDMSSTETEPFSKKTGGKCCTVPDSCHGCTSDCTMPAAYYDSMVDLAASTGHQFIFGLVPELDQATALISYAATHQKPVFAYSFGNEVDSAAVTAGYQPLQQLVADLFPPGTGQQPPALVGPDVALQRHTPIAQALADKDHTVEKKLAWVETFTREAGEQLDAVGWHTYDFETYDIGMTDHQVGDCSSRTSSVRCGRHSTPHSKTQHSTDSTARTA